MLQYINLRNYKAFEVARIPLKPITILLGANSVGKSSIIQLMLMLQQTGKAGLKSYRSPLKLYGGYVNLGDAINLFRNRDTSTPLHIGFEIKSKILTNMLKETLFKSYVQNFHEIPYYVPIKGFSDLSSKPIKDIKNYNLYIDSIIEILTKAQINKTYPERINWMLRNKNEFYIPEITKHTKKQFSDAYEFLEALSKFIKNESFEINYNIKYNEGSLAISLIELRHNDKILLQLNNVDFVEMSVVSDIIDFDKSEVKHILKCFDECNTIFNSFEENNEKDDINMTVRSSIVLKLFRTFQREIKKEFIEDSINYVSPLRAHPKRYYMLDKAKLNLNLDTLDGDAIAEVIKDDSKIKTKVNRWFKKFGLQIDVQGFKEVIHHLKVKQNNLELDITDVGFGISQILPVIIQGFLSTDNSTTIIEQPEIHLHPKIQADLADLFIDIVKAADGKKLIIETHSEYILKRLRRRISEESISPNHVAICLIDPQTTSAGAVFNELKIEEKGFFEWPIDFYGGDLYDDTVEFLKNQN